MSNNSTQALPLGTTPAFANMHKWLKRGLIVCLTALVIEGAFIVPFCLVWYGWPTLTIKQMCDEMLKVRYSDEAAECIYPYPLFGPAEGTLHAKTAQEDWGVQPRPLYKRIGFRDLIKWRNERLARQAAEAEQAAKQATAPPSEPSAAELPPQQ